VIQRASTLDSSGCGGSWVRGNKLGVKNRPGLGRWLHTPWQVIKVGLRVKRVIGFASGCVCV